MMSSEHIVMFAHADKLLLSKIYISNDTDAFSLKLVFKSVKFLHEFVHKFFLLCMNFCAIFLYEKLVMLLHYVMENWENQNILTSHIENSISQCKTQYGTVSNKFDECFA